MVLASATALAQQKPQVEPLSLGQAKCVNSGTGDQFFRVCWSQAGNVNVYEAPKGHQHMSGAEEY